MATRWFKLLLLLVGLVCAPRAAEARFYNPPGKAGPLMFNLKLGAAIGVVGDSYLVAPRTGFFSSPDQFALQFDFGVALDRDRQAYLIFPIQFQLGGSRYTSYGYDVVMLGVGFQYDIPIAPSKVPGLYIYPRLTVGYAPFVFRDYGNGIPISQRTDHGGFVAPEFGVKYVLKQRWNFGFEPFSLPIFFDDVRVSLNYRLLWYAGVNF